MKMKNQMILKTLCLCVFVVNFNLLAEEPAIISLQPECRTFYAGREHTLTILIKNASGETLSWNLRYAGRTLASGMRKIPPNGEVKISFKFPKLNPGVIAETEFSCWVGKQALGTRRQALGEEKRGQGRKEGEHRRSNIEHSTSNEKELKRTLYFFYPNPFDGQKKALKERQIGVWEATEEENLSELLKSLDIPFAKVADPEQFSGKVLLVCGLDFDSSPGALDALLNLAEKGSKIIIMPPISGKFPLKTDKLDGIILGGNEYIGIRSQAPGIRKKFDTKNWNGKAINKKSFNLAPDGETVGIGIKKHRTSNIEHPISNEKKTGFTYCELRVKEALGTRHQALDSKTEASAFALRMLRHPSLNEKRGALIITTWDIVKEANASPTPVYLLREMLVRD